MQLLFPLASLTLYSRECKLKCSYSKCLFLAARLVITYFKHNRELDATLASNTTLNRNAFLKLLVLGLFDILLTLPIMILSLITELLESKAAGFWPGWKAVHSSYSTIPQLTTQEWKSAGFWTVFIIKFNQWIFPAYAIVFFLLFGTTKQKREWYRSVFWMVMRPLGLRPRDKVESPASTIVFGPGPMVRPAAVGGMDTRVKLM